MDPLKAIDSHDLKWLRGSLVLLTRTGSHSYGTNVEGSDEDFKGIAIPPKQYYLGTQIFEQAEFHEPDMVVYELKKFVRLAADCNPNIIEVLYSDPSDHALITPLGELLLKHRELFLSKKARHSFAGYAHAQLKRMKNHYFRNTEGSWENPPTRSEFGLPEKRQIAVDQLGAAEAAVQKIISSWNLDLSGLDPAVRIELMNHVNQFMTELFADKNDLYRAVGRGLGYQDNFLDLLERERRFRAAQKEHESYKKWKQNRNPKRAQLEKDIGYDAKHGLHLIRLLRMCREILTTGQVLVKRPDREELLAIRNGAWTFDQIVEWAEKEDLAMDELYKSSALPRSPDHGKINDLVVELLDRALGGKDGHPIQ